MATKNLSRSAIEGGRTGAWKIERKQSLRQQRRKTNAAIDGARDNDDREDLVMPERGTTTLWVDDKFKDRLNGPMRWMKSKVGQSWDKVHSELKKKFDSRTTAGRHILFDHLLDSVWTSQDRSTFQAQYSRFYVDAQGILRENEDRFKRSKHSWSNVLKERPAINEWLNGRLIGKIGNVFYWFEPTIPPAAEMRLVWDKRYYHSDLELEWQYKVDKEWYPRYTSYRQTARFEGKDIEFFSALTEKNQTKLLEHSPLVKKYYGSKSR
jgi:hypothetical protein